MSRPTVAVVGASVDRRKFGNKCVRAYAQAGYCVYPVNPHAPEIEGWRAFPSLDDLPGELDRITVYLPPEKSLTLIPALARRRGSQVWFNPGAGDARVLAAARAAGLQVYDGCSIVDIGLSPSRFP